MHQLIKIGNTHLAASRELLCRDAIGKQAIKDLKGRRGICDRKRFLAGGQSQAGNLHLSPQVCLHFPFHGGRPPLRQLGEVIGFPPLFGGPLLPGSRQIPGRDVHQGQRHRRAGRLGPAIPASRLAGFQRSVFVLRQLDAGPEKRPRLLHTLAGVPAYGRLFAARVRLQDANNHLVHLAMIHHQHGQGAQLQIALGSRHRKAAELVIHHKSLAVPDSHHIRFAGKQAVPFKQACFPQRLNIGPVFFHSQVLLAQVNFHLVAPSHGLCVLRVLRHCPLLHVGMQHGSQGGVIALFVHRALPFCIPASRAKEKPLHPAGAWQPLTFVHLNGIGIKHNRLTGQGLMIIRTKGGRILRYIQAGNTVFRRRSGYRRRGLRRFGSRLGSGSRYRSLRQGGFPGRLVVIRKHVLHPHHSVSNAVVHLPQLYHLRLGRLFQLVAQIGFKLRTGNAVLPELRFQGTDDVGHRAGVAVLQRLFGCRQSLFRQPAGEHLQDAGADAAGSHVGAKLVHVPFTFQGNTFHHLLASLILVLVAGVIHREGNLAAYIGFLVKAESYALGNHAAITVRPLRVPVSGNFLPPGLRIAPGSDQGFGQADAGPLHRRSSAGEGVSGGLGQRQPGTSLVHAGGHFGQIPRKLLGNPDRRQHLGYGCIARNGSQGSATGGSLNGKRIARCLIGEFVCCIRIHVIITHAWVLVTGRESGPTDPGQLNQFLHSSHSHPAIPNMAAMGFTPALLWASLKASFTPKEIVSGLPEKQVPEASK
nr:MAG TPA: hypothetical protein [Bacteriophage sp.]